METKEKKKKKLTSPSFPSSSCIPLSLELRSHFLLIAIAVHRFRQVCESAHLLLSSVPLSLCLMMSIIDSGCLPLRIIPERISFSSSLSPSIYLSIDLHVLCICDSRSMNDSKHGSIHIEEREREQKNFIDVLWTWDDLHLEVIIDTIVETTNFDRISWFVCVCVWPLRQWLISKTSWIYLSLFRALNGQVLSLFSLILSLSLPPSLSVPRPLDQHSRGDTWYFVLSNARKYLR